MSRPRIGNKYDSNRSTRRLRTPPKVRAVDLFCGAGGLTHGLERAGIEVRLGYDADPACQFPFESNNRARFRLADVTKLNGDELRAEWHGAISLLAGCAPCQPFSSYSQGNKSRLGDPKWRMLDEFARVIVESKPDLVTMENVPNLAKHDVFLRFVGILDVHGYEYDFGTVESQDYGVPQNRSRLILLASRLGPVTLPTPTHKPSEQLTVRRAIEKLPFIEAGGTDPKDVLHTAAGLSEINLSRIRHSRPGGTWTDWPEELIAPCHTRATGSRYKSVYGRMMWDRPAPTITTQCYNFGSGRFGHPSQDRAISLREAAILQSFPRRYRFTSPGERPNLAAVARLIGNAVPVRLGEVIGRALLAHVRKSRCR